MRQQFRINCQNKLQQTQIPQSPRAGKKNNTECAKERRMAQAAKELDCALRGAICSAGNNPSSNFNSQEI